VGVWGLGEREATGVGVWVGNSVDVTSGSDVSDGGKGVGLMVGETVQEVTRNRKDIITRKRRIPIL
jgi:hypothetical protein